ncbi:MAG TPA: glycosyltransferase family 2 protein [Holophagaceae bacterium]
MSRISHVGIVTVTYNSAPVIEPFLRCVLAQSHGAFTLYVIDNASADDTLERIAPVIDPRIVLVRNPANRGIAAGNNQGIQLAHRDRCSHVLLLNNDTEFGPELLAGLLERMEAHGCDLIAPKMYFFDRPDRLWYAGGGFMKHHGYTTFSFGQGEVDLGQFDAARVVEFCPTCCTLVRMSVFEAIGLMDETYFVYWDDIDFLYRALRAGLVTRYEPGLRLWHKVSSLTGGKQSAFSLYFGARNKVYFLFKHRPIPEFLLSNLANYLYLAARTLAGSVPLSQFRIRQRGFLDGFRMAFALGGPSDARRPQPRRLEEPGRV